ncbi:hypothetical protein [Planctomycetes bacterium K23_9]|uniref:Uncharacterized protein n=1 Tax=Stieleria marina TaxID=1930275 RepID=A0A517NNX7_9BACT|nr:hypothetical protein K239x_07640 [Planctomycetes bacterium K23_9]
MKRNLDQQSAIMIAIDHCGGVSPGQKCSAVFFDDAKIEKEKAFYSRCCNDSGMTDPAEVEAMVAAQVPSQPYWLVSLKSPDEATEKVQFHRIDDRTGQVI